MVTQLEARVAEATGNSTDLAMQLKAARAEVAQLAAAVERLERQAGEAKGRSAQLESELAAAREEVR